MSHYRFEHDPAMSLNLDGTVEVLQFHQARLHSIAAAVMRDIEIVTDALVKKRVENVLPYEAGKES